MFLLKKLAVILLVGISVTCITVIILSFGIIEVPLEDEFINIPAKLKLLEEAELLISEGNEAIIWMGSLYEREEFLRFFNEGQNEARQLIVKYQILPIIVFSLSVFLLLLIKSWVYRCPKCKRWFVMKKQSADYVRGQSAYFAKKTGESVSSWSGKVTEEHYSEVRHTYVAHKATYKCKKCGNIKTVIKKGKWKRDDV